MYTNGAKGRLDMAPLTMVFICQFLLNVALGWALTETGSFFRGDWTLGRQAERLGRSECNYVSVTTVRDSTCRKQTEATVEALGAP